MWGDLKVFKDHVFIVSEAYDHGVQVYDLRQLRNLKASKPGRIAELSESTHYMESLAQHTTLWPMKTPASCTLWAVALVTVDYTWSISMILLIQSLLASHNYIQSAEA